MPIDRAPSEFTIVDGHAVIPAATPDNIIRALFDVLLRCALPPIFRAGSVLTMNRWMPHVADEAELPKITWKVIHTVPHPSPKERITHTTVTNGQPIEHLQQDFNHIVQFDCFARTEEEAAMLEWWLVRHLYLYRYVAADAGAQHLRYHEGREDFTTALPTDRYPARAVRFAFQTSLTFSAVRPRLDRVSVNTRVEDIPLTAHETIIRGEDILSEQGITLILAVTSPDGTITYTPTYLPQQRQFVWTPDQRQPARGSQYVVTYLYTGPERATAPS